MRINTLAMTVLMLSAGAISPAQRAPGGTSEQEVYGALRQGTMWVHPSAARLVDRAAIDRLASDLRPSELKVLVIPNLGARWNQGGQERRGAFARYLSNDRLKLGDGMAIVVTRRGIAGYDRRLPERTLASLNNQAARRMSRTDFTPGIVWLATEINRRAGSAATAGTSSSADAPLAPARTQSSGSGTGLLWLLGLGGVGGFAWWRSRKAAELRRVREPLEQADREVIEGISYLDSYDGLLNGPAAQSLLAARTAANEAWEPARERLAALKTPADGEPIRRLLEEAARHVHEGRNVIEEATGGTKTAFRLPRSLAEVDAQRAPLFDPRPGTCFFTGMPSDDLQPVELSIDGKRRTVLASPEARANLQSGQAPTIAGDASQGRFLPWYAIPNYQPGYGRGAMGGFDGGSLMTSMLLFSAFNALTPPFVVNNSTVVNGGGDFGSGDFGSGAFGDSGGFDTSGGFDFGGGDAGDSGGDFGGGDFGGGDF